MAVLGSGSAKKAIKKKAVSLPNFELDQGTQIFLGVDSEGNSRLVPWNVHCPRVRTATEDYATPEGIQDEYLKSLTHAPDPIDLPYAWGDPSTTTLNLNAKLSFTHQIPGQDAVFMFAANSTSSGYGPQGSYVAVANVTSTDALTYDYRESTFTAAAADACFAAYLKDDASYWYYICMVTLNANSTYVRMFRVAKADFAITSTNICVISPQHSTEAQVYRVDTDNERIYFKNSTNYSFFDYDTAGFSVDSVETATTAAATVQTWGRPSNITTDSSDTCYFVDPDNLNVTYLLHYASLNNKGKDVTGNTGSGSGANSKANMRLYRMEHDGTLWHVSQIREIVTSFPVITIRYGLMGEGGGYFHQPSNSSLENKGRLIYIDEVKSRMIDIFAHNNIATGGNGVQKAVTPSNLNYSGVYDDPPFKILSMLGNYINGTRYWFGDVFVEGEARAGIDIRGLIVGLDTGNSAINNYGSIANTLNHPHPIILKEDANFSYGFVLISDITGTATPDRSVGMFRAPRPCTKISRSPVARVTQTPTMGRYAMNMVRFSGVPSNGDTVTIGSVVYTFKTALTPTAGEVLIGASATTASQNLGQAIHQKSGSGSDWAAGTTTNPDVTAVEEDTDMNGDICTILRTIEKTDTVISCTESATNVTIDHATMQDGQTRTDPELEFYQGAEYTEVQADSGQVYDNESYEVKPTVGTFDMSHVELQRVENIKISDQGAVTQDSEDIAFLEYNGPIRLIEQTYVNSSVGEWQNTVNYFASKGNKLLISKPESTALFTQALFEVGIMS